MSKSKSRISDRYSFEEMKETDLQFQNRRTLMILLGVLVTLVVITVMTVLMKN